MEEAPENIFESLGAELEQETKENLSLCKAENEAVLLNDGAENWYEIPFSDCDSHEKIVRWVFHLTTKDWITTKHLHLFLCQVFVRFPKLAPK